MYIWALYYILLFNESLLHYLSTMCVIMMNDSFYVLVYTSACGEATLILCVAFSFTTCIIMVVVSLLKKN